jgi:hypothetical protein
MRSFPCCARVQTRIPWVHREGGGGDEGGEDGGSDDSDGDRMQEFVVVVIRHRSPCTPARGIATRLSPDLNEVAVLGVLFAPYNEEDGRECTYYEMRAIAEEDDGGNGK